MEGITIVITHRGDTGYKTKVFINQEQEAQQGFWDALRGNV